MKKTKTIKNVKTSKNNQSKISKKNNTKISTTKNTKKQKDEFKGMDSETIIKKTRHKAEKPLRNLFFVLSIISYLLIGFVALICHSDEQIKNEIMREVLKNTTHQEEATKIMNFLFNAGMFCTVIAIIGLFLLLIVLFYFLYGGCMSFSIKVTEKNFPEIYKKSIEYSKKLNLTKVPEIYIEQQNGLLNAFSSFIPGKRFILLNSEIVDIAYMENKDFDTVFFVMAHEFGHIYLKHVTLFYKMMTFIPSIIPVLGGLLSRAQEYSCDRVAQALTNNKNVKECMLLLGAGRHLYKKMSVDDYMKSAKENHNILENISRFFVNILSTHPIMIYRTEAALDPKRKSGKLI